jgi:multisubunit Na+/H+ antiporter MnhG subunit
MRKSGHSFLYYLLLFIVFYFLIAPLIIREFNRQNGVVEGFSGVSFTGSFFIIFAVVAVICFLAFFLFKSLFKD